MAEGITLKRIIDMDEATELTSSDYALVDSATGGPKKFALGDELSSLKEDKADIDSVYVTDTASGSIASFPDGADNVPVKSLTVDIEPVQSGSGDPSPDNVRPISGHTQAIVTRTGANIAKGVEVGTGTHMYATSLYIDCELKPSTFYMLSFDGLSGQQFYANEKVFSWTSVTVGDARATLIVKTRPDISKSSPSQYYNNKWIVLKNNAAFNEAPVINNVQLEVGSTASEYEEPHVQTVTIDLDGTIYGGTLDVTTGVLTVDRAMVDMGALEWAFNSESGHVFMCRLSGIEIEIDPPYENRRKGVICSIYSPDQNQFAISDNMTDKTWLRLSNAFFVKDTSYATISAFTTAVSGQQMVYLLQNPQTIQLTAQEVRTLLGQNNIYADTGDVDVEYRADTKLYIEKLTAPTEDDLIADHAISANSFFMVGNTLYRATTAIASGATITVGTNATKLSLSDALNALS